MLGLIVLAVVIGRGVGKKTTGRHVESVASKKISVSKSSPSKKKSHDLYHLVTTIAQPGPAVTALFRTKEKHLILMDVETSEPRWTTDAVNEDFDPEDVTSVGGRILVLTSSSVYALRLEDGAVAWKASLVADYVTHKHPSRVLGDRLVVELRDGTTQVLDVASGATVWAMKELVPPPSFLGASDVLVHFRTNERKRTRPREALVIDVATGQIRHTLSPSCSTHSIIPANTPGTTDPALLSPDGHELYLFYGFNRFCVERWDLRSGKRTWQTNTPAGDAQVSNDVERSLLMDEDRIVYAARGGTFAVARRNGALTKVAEPEDCARAPAFLHGNLLVLATSSTWGAADCAEVKNCALWGVDLGKRRVIWKYVPPKAERPITSRWPFAGILTPQALSLAQQAGSGRIVFDRLDLVTGVSKLHQIIQTGASTNREMGWPRPYAQAGLFWIEDQGWSVLDPDTGTVRYHLD